MASNPIDRSEAKKQQILLAAEDVFLEKGFHAASMVEIAKKANVSPPHIYNFYENKSALAIAVKEKMNRETFRVLQEIMVAKQQGEPGCPKRNLAMDERRASLMLTILAEGVRNEKVKEQIVESSLDLKKFLMKMYRIDSKDEKGQLRLEVMMSLFLGLSIRNVFGLVEETASFRRMVEGVESWVVGGKQLNV